MTRIGAYPGSFNPLTVAHLAIAEAARDQCHLDRVDLVVSRVALAKEHVRLPTLEHRLAVLERAAAVRPWLGLVVSDAQLVADLAEGYDVVVLGADKWAQVRDARFYGGSPSRRDQVLARLPPVAVVPRPPQSVAEPGTLMLVVEGTMGVSSTGARSGRTAWMATEAAAFDAESGAWTDPGRYRHWLSGQ